MQELDFTNVVEEVPSHVKDKESQVVHSLAKEEGIVSFQAELPEPLQLAMKGFIERYPNWDQYKVMSSALANFLFQNGCEDRAVVQRYLNDLFNHGGS